MQTMELVGAGALARPDGQSDLTALPWNPHPSFIGVALKHLVTSADTLGALSAHLVRIAPGAELKTHIHDRSLELHEVVRGSGVCTLGDRQAVYQPGVCGLIPAGVAHSVRADAEEELYILAKFTPALL
ncbi:MAG: cupin domain-containing protein [Proteobacteria bacterium]|nr:cupin domain-containing protein [Pseudomonadota bacterium]